MENQPHEFHYSFESETMKISFSFDLKNAVQQGLVHRTDPGNAHPMTHEDAGDDPPQEKPSTGKSASVGDRSFRGDGSNGEPDPQKAGAGF